MTSITPSVAVQTFVQSLEILALLQTFAVTEGCPLESSEDGRGTKNMRMKSARCPREMVTVKGGKPCSETGQDRILRNELFKCCHGYATPLILTRDFQVYGGRPSVRREKHGGIQRIHSGCAKALSYFLLQPRRPVLCPLSFVDTTLATAFSPLEHDLAC